MIEDIHSPGLFEVAIEEATADSELEGLIRDKLVLSLFLVLGTLNLLGELPLLSE
jgi:hypothetical protein